MEASPAPIAGRDSPSGGSRYGYKKISDALELTVNLLSFLHRTPNCRFGTTASGSYLLHILTVTTGGQYCHTEGSRGGRLGVGALVIVWSRLK